MTTKKKTWRRKRTTKRQQTTWKKRKNWLVGLVVHANVPADFM
jgi:hypothetical protein